MRQNLIFITFLLFGEWLHILCITLLQHDKIVFIMDFFFNCDEISERLYILRWIPHFHSSKIKQNSNYMKMYLHCSDFFIVRDAGIHHAISCRSSTAFHFRKCTRILRFYIIISSILFVCRRICIHFRDVHESFLFCLFRQKQNKKISISHWNTLCSELFFRMAWVAWVVYKK